MSEEIVNSEDMQFYEYLGLLEQAYYDTHAGSKAGTIITETIKSYVNILKYKNNKLQQKVEDKNKEIDRLNNIINKIQDMCREEYYKKNTTDIDSIGLSNNIWVMIYMKIKENNKNE